MTDDELNRVIAVRLGYEWMIRDAAFLIRVGSRGSFKGERVSGVIEPDEVWQPPFDYATDPAEAAHLLQHMPLELRRKLRGAAPRVISEGWLVWQRGQGII